MVDSDFILAPAVVKVEFAIQPVINALESMQLLNESHRLSGLGEWVTQTAATLPAERMRQNLLVFDGLEPFVPSLLRKQHPDFPSYIDDLAAQDPTRLVAEIGHDIELITSLYPELWTEGKRVPTFDELLADRDVFINFMETISQGDCADPTIWDEAHALYNNPPALVETIVSHLRWMWDETLAAEWERVLPLLQESVAAFQKIDYRDMTAYEAIRAVTGRDIRSFVEKHLQRTDTLLFIPSAHIGPYVGKISGPTGFCLVFGARLPRGAQATSSALSRSELLIRLNALADDTRLRILELMTQHEELCAQDIIERLGVSQSTVSRHLSQLSATGYITERRREVSKCYSLNTDRVVDTLRALTNFLSRQ